MKIPFDEEINSRGQSFTANNESTTLDPKSFIQCKTCGGEKFVVKQKGKQKKKETCPVCKGVGVVPKFFDC